MPTVLKATIYGAANREKSDKENHKIIIFPDFGGELAKNLTVRIVSFYMIRPSHTKCVKMSSTTAAPIGPARGECGAVRAGQWSTVDHIQPSEARR